MELELSVSSGRVSVVIYDLNGSDDSLNGKSGLPESLDLIIVVTDEETERRVAALGSSRQRRCQDCLNGMLEL